eukprot:GHVU01128239.1.p1 GENE.GHVU01128239.1~~GHVU01128239.1.p1  ORF type:complete len:134 (-),score=12.92 GHVU01128239.1:103-504(-)
MAEGMLGRRLGTGKQLGLLRDGQTIPCPVRIPAAAREPSNMLFSLNRASSSSGTAETAAIRASAVYRSSPRCKPALHSTPGGGVLYDSNPKQAASNQGCCGRTRRDTKLTIPNDDTERTSLAPSPRSFPPRHP